jgi:hypothetical protein
MLVMKTHLGINLEFFCEFAVPVKVAVSPYSAVIDPSFDLVTLTAANACAGDLEFILPT